MQSAAVPPRHVAHEASHVWQRELLSAYVPSGHTLMQALLW